MFGKQLTRLSKLRNVIIPLLLFSLSTIAISQDDGLSCIGEINVALDPINCTGSISADMIVNPSEFDPINTYTVEVRDENLTLVDNLFDANDVNKTFKVSVVATGSGISGTGSGSSSCWGYATIDKIGAPEIQCPTTPIVVSCLVDIANLPDPRPQITTTCGVDVQVRQIGIDVVTPICNTSTPNIVANVVRVYEAFNSFGAKSGPCEVNYQIEVFDIHDIRFPTVAADPDCTDPSFSDDPQKQGIPFILTTGSGTIVATGSGTGVVGLDTTFIFPTPTSFCNILVTKEEEIIRESSCKTTLYRKWTVQQWLCNNTEEIAEREQVLTITDTDGPNFNCPTTTINTAANNINCEAFVDLPTLDIDDSCSEVKSVEMHHMNGVTLSNGGTIALPIGNQIVKYIGVDACDNVSECEVNVNVTGAAPPVVICEQHVAISLTNNGTAHVPASVFDDGSYGCGFRNVLVAKMSDICGDTVVTNPDFADHVKFCCAEAINPPMVRLRAYNQDGSYNECMTEVTIQDKNQVSLVCPTSLEVSCDFAYDDSYAAFGKVATTLADRDNFVIDAKSVTFVDGLTVGRDGLATGGCGMVVLENVNVDESTFSCGTGTIKRTFTLNNGIDSQSCIQTINIVGGEGFDGIIAWPQDTTLDIACGVADISPDFTGRPSFTQGDCQQLAATYVDETFTNVEIDGTCRKIFRYWSIIDWCNTDPLSGLPNRYPTTGDGRWLQVIKVVKNEKPVVTCTGDALFESVEASCMVSDVSLSASVTGCPNTTEYAFQFLLDLNCDGSIDSIGNTNIYNDTVIAGDHCITWTATDLCGNISLPCTDNFKVRNNKGPSAVCIANLTVSLDSMDILGNDGVLDTVMAVLWAQDIDSGSSQSCGNPVSFSFSPDSIVNGMEFTCDDANRRVRVGLYVFDDLTGTVGECWSEVEVQDLLGKCSSTSNSNRASVSGLITTESGENIGATEVTLLGSELPENMTGINGQYAFNNMPMGGAYTVMAQKDQDHINGVSTLDLVLIQKHILGLDLLDSPYKMIAADINKSNNISASDIVELRKLILGEQSEFSKNTSWRFIDKAYNFPESSNPWSEIFPEEYDITSLDKSMSIDFVGLKVGDVSGNASSSNVNIAEVRTTPSPLNLVVEVDQDDLENLVTFSISSNNFENVLGFQTTLEFDASTMVFEGLNSNSLEMSDENVGISYIDRGMITLSWSSSDELSFNDTEELFELVFKQTGSVVSDLSVSSDITNTEAYFNGNITDKITLTSKNSLYGLTVGQNEPNPWSDQTSVNFSISESGYVGFNVMDLSGKLIISKSNYFTAGDNSIYLDRVDVPSAGLYLYEIYSQGQKVTKKMIILD